MSSPSAGDNAYDCDVEYWEQKMEHLVTEDDTPVDNRFSERQQHLLPTILFASWPEGKPFEAVSNVGLFYSLEGEPPVVPDFMLSLGVEPRPVSAKKADRSYMTWVYGKAPDLVVEVVSNTKGGELDTKLEIYTKVRVTYYVVFDPFLLLGQRELRVFKLVEGRYVDMLSPHWLPEIGLGFTVWEGPVGDVTDRWLRFIDAEGELLPTAEENLELAHETLERARAKLESEREQLTAEKERAEAEKERAEAEKERAEAEKQRAEAETERAEQAENEAQAQRQKVERLREKLLELGVNPDELS